MTRRNSSQMEHNTLIYQRFQNTRGNEIKQVSGQRLALAVVKGDDVGVGVVVEVRCGCT